MDINIKPNTSLNNKTSGWRTFKPKTDINKCIGCGRCALVCPENCILMIKKDNNLKPNTNYNYCKGCGLCVLECASKAIIMEKEKK